MTLCRAFIIFSCLAACLLPPLSGHSQYRNEPVSWEKGDTSGYYQDKEGAVFHVSFPGETEDKILAADRLVPAGKKEPLHLLFYTRHSKQEAALIFSDKKSGEPYNARDDFWIWQIKYQKLTPIEKPVPEIFLDYANIYTLYKNGNLYLSRHKPDSARLFLRQGLNLAGALDDPYLEANGWYLECRRYIIANALDSAQQVIGKALELFEQTGSQKDIAACYNYYSIIFRKMGDFPQSLDYGLKALRANEQLKYKPGVSRALASVGNVYLNTGQLDNALTTFTRSLTVNSIIEDTNWIKNSLLNIGAAYQKKGVLDSALLYYRKALKIALQLNDKADERILLTNIGSALLGKGKPDSSIFYLNKALAIARSYDFEQAHLLNDMVETYLYADSPAVAKKYARLAIEAAEREQNLDQLQYAWLTLSRAHAGTGDYTDAYNALKKHAVLKDSVFNNEKTKVLNQLSVKYNTEKKEQAIERLTREKTESRFRRNTYLVAGILIIVILLLLFNRQRLKTRKNREMYEKRRELEQMKNTFFSNISHEFRTPLTLILGPIRSLYDATDDPETIRQLNTMEHNAQRLLSLIDQLLYLSKLESGRLELSVERQDIVKLIRGNVMNFSSLAASKKIDLSITTSLSRLVMSFDKEKMETMLINLLSNAFKFTPDGGSIGVSVNIEEHGNSDDLLVCVRDSGAGIAENDLPYVFDRYYQGEEGRQSFRAGSGIGLAMVKELTQLHKGTIEVFSKHGEGTEIKISLPIGKDYESNELAVEKSRELPDEITGTEEALAVMSGENEEETVVLVIEDNRDVMRYIRDVLEKEYRVLSAEDGEEGIHKAIEEIPDLIISDVMMPKKDGYEVCHTLKHDERTSHIPLILLTAKADYEDKLQGLRQQADEYLTKPFYPKELLLRTANLINSRKALQAKYRKELVLKPMGVTAPSMEEAFLQKLMQAVEENMDKEDFTVEMLAGEVSLSRSQLHRKLHALTHQSATGFIRYYRLTRAMEMLQRHSGTIAEVAYKVGFSSPSYFNKMFVQQYGITPGQVRATVRQ